MAAPSSTLLYELENFPRFPIGPPCTRVLALTETENGRSRGRHWRGEGGMTQFVGRGSSRVGGGVGRGGHLRRVDVEDRRGSGTCLRRRVAFREL